MKDIRNVIGSGEGQQYEWTFTMAGISLRGQSVVVEYVENQRACHQGIGMIESMWTASVEAIEGGARLTIDVECKLPLFVLGTLSERATVKRNGRDLEKSLERIKRFLENSR